MSVLLLQDNASPVATVQIVYRVGSKYEVLGNTGSTHLLEHLMFKGTPTFNKKNGNTITDVLQNTGAQLNATTWYDRTNYFETLPSDKIEFLPNGQVKRYEDNVLLYTDTYSISNTCNGYANNDRSLFLKQIDSEDGDEYCFIINGINENNSGILSLTTSRQGKLIVYIRP